jgi:hypothetical protein
LLQSLTDAVVQAVAGVLVQQRQPETATDLHLADFEYVVIATLGQQSVGYLLQKSVDAAVGQGRLQRVEDIGGGIHDSTFGGEGRAGQGRVMTNDEIPKDE